MHTIGFGCTGDTRWGGNLKKLPFFLIIEDVQSLGVVIRQ